MKRGEKQNTQAATGDQSIRAPHGIRELAAELGISIGTISRAMNGRPNVNPATKARVLEAAERLGYRPQQSGLSLRTGTTRTIGLLWEIPFGRENYGDAFFLSLFIGVQAQLFERGYDLTILFDRPSSGGLAEPPLGRLKDAIQRRQVDAFIIPWTRVTDARLAYCAKQAVPFTALGRSRSGGNHPWIDLDFEGAIYKATRRLLGFGHRHIGLILVSSALMQNQFIIAGYKKALAEDSTALDDKLIVQCEAIPQGGIQATDKLLGLRARPSAFIVIDSAVIVGVYVRLAELGLRCGQDISVIGGVQDNPIPEFLSPPLTCFGLDTIALGKRLAEVALFALDKDETEAERPVVAELWPLKLIARGSDGSIQ
ncbi:LacI family DNA-binding transcriptional regulator [Acidisoma cellulosilytica]|uniref:LacI family DNA-binding transcriptional regulator n=1 Tax=Acidisoma cellulosilyticum TaxID=2802395 RepID=A0A963Z8F2_9PROT|nr:LacI family DNA-binding transcriptional regulator [Acidisoma cellulosilyticum]MCB8883763.1 LacI family DNA-binding transcriptional regulator [Acidisoma cellulosilyticum]